MCIEHQQTWIKLGVHVLLQIARVPHKASSYDGASSSIHAIISQHQPAGLRSTAAVDSIDGKR